MEGKALRLTALGTTAAPKQGDELFVAFRDATTGRETYEVGRYFFVPFGGADVAYVLDFNLATNPLCNYSPHYNCPIPLRENTLPVAIRAGEMTFRGSTADPLRGKPPARRALGHAALRCTPRLGSAAPQSPPPRSSPRGKAKALLRADPCDALRPCSGRGELAEPRGLNAGSPVCPSNRWSTGQRLTLRQRTDAGLQERTAREAIPSFTCAVDQARATPQGYAAAERSPDIGVTAKYGITSSVTVEGTVNPDFSQVESDAFQVIVNQRYPVFYVVPPAIPRAEAGGGKGLGTPGRSVPRLIMTLLTPAQIEAELGAVPGWSHQDQSIVRTFQFKDFAAAIAFVNKVATLADQAWHHPDIDVRWNKVTLTLSTHDAGGLTKHDFSLAASIDAL